MSIDIKDVVVEPRWEDLESRVDRATTEAVRIQSYGVEYVARCSTSPAVTADIALEQQSVKLLRLQGLPGATLEVRLKRENEVEMLGARRLDASGIHCVRMPTGTGRGQIEIRPPDGYKAMVLGELRVCRLPRYRPSAASEGRPGAYVGLASIPSRVTMLEQVVARLSKQADHIFVYLNGFVSVPEFLRAPGITVLRSQDFGDHRDNSKFFGLYLIDGEAFYLTVDDDIDYPDDYVEVALAGVEGYLRKAVVGFHGVIYGAGSRHFRDRYVVHFERGLDYDLPVNVLGTGTIAFHTGTYRPECLDFEESGMADLVVGSELAANGTPMVVLSRGEAYLKSYAHEAGAVTLFDETKGQDTTAHDLLIRRTSWSLRAVPDVSIGNEARILLAYEEALREGVEPHRIAVPWSNNLQALAAKLGLPPLATAGARWRVATLAQRMLRRSGDWIDECQSAAVDFLKSHLEGLALIKIAEVQVDSGDVSLVTDDSWLETFDTEGNADLKQAYAAVQLLHVAGRRQKLQFLKASCDAMDWETVARLSSVYKGCERTLDAAVTVALARIRIRAGAYEDVVYGAPALLASGWDGRVLLAIAALSSGRPWASAIVEDALDVRPNRRRLRRLRELAMVMRTVDSDLIAPMRLMRALDEVSAEVAVEFAAVLLHHGFWDESLDHSGFPLGRHERALWSGEIGRLSTKTSAASVSAINRVLLGGGMLPIEVEGTDPIFERMCCPNVEKLAPSPELPLVTIVIAAFNSDSSLEYAVRSVGDQTYPNIEVIIVDDASERPINSSIIPEGCSASIIRLNENVGPYMARNVGIAHAKGDIIGFHDADDWMHPQKIETQVNRLRSPGIVAVYDRHIRLRSDGRLAFENHGRYIGDGPITGLFKRVGFERAGAFLRVRTRGDIEFRARLLSVFGKGAVVQRETVSVLALDAEHTNSKISVKTWRDQADLQNFKLQYMGAMSLRPLRPFVGWESSSGSAHPAHGPARGDRRTASYSLWRDGENASL